MAQRLITICAVVVGGPIVDKNGKVTETNEQTLAPGSSFEFDDKTAADLLAKGAARLPVADVPAEPAEPAA